MIERLSRRHVVLLGVGHTNAHVLRMWRMHAPPDTDLTCISNFPVVTYSGMLPAVLAGQFPKEAMEIDLVRLCESASARLITDPVIGIDHARRELRFENRPNVPFDFLSIGIGSVPTLGDVEIQGDQLIRIKPMQTFLDRMRTAIESAVANSNRENLKVVVVGSGVAGIEVAFCLPPFLATVTDRRCDLKVMTRSETVVPDLEPRTRRFVSAELERRGITVSVNSEVKQILPNSIVLHDSTQVEADLVIWATGAAPPPLLAQLGLAVNSRGFLETKATLESTSAGGVFAVGDTGSIRDVSLPKAGVFAVRQSPVLWENLHRYLDGKPLQEYRPQRSFMKLINLGDGRAVGQWKRLTFSGRWVLWLKHHIDSGFMEMFRVEPGMSMGTGDSAEADELQQQCRGCGCKLDADVLASALNIAEGAHYEDAAEIASTEQGSLIASTDFFSSPFQDPFLAGRIAALHSASDVIASAGIPSSALANVVLPPGDANSQRRALADLLEGARQEFSAMGASLVGGHTIVGPRMELGFTVIGISAGRELMRKGNLRVGDHLYLTRPLGTGVLLAAHMRCECRAADYMELVATMLQRQSAWAKVTSDCGITAGTDITGFGLAGHLLEMLEASHVSAVLRLDAVPALPGVIESLSDGIRSTLAPANRRVESMIEADDLNRKRPEYELLFDPQTCGGLLLGVPEGAKTRMLQEANRSGLPVPVLIGHVESGEGRARPLRLIQ